MKTTLIIIALFLSVCTLASNETILKSSVKKVTVFLNSAQVYRSADFSANAGITELVFEGVSPYLNSKSIQVTGKGDYVILDVQYRVKQPVIPEPQFQTLPPKIVKDIELLNDSLSQLAFDIENIANKKNNLELEKKVLLGNKFMQGNADTIPELVASMEYLRKQLNDINTTMNLIRRQEYKILKEKSRMESRLNDLNNYNAQVNPPVIEQPIQQIVVTIQSENTVSGNITINYMVGNAGWAPAYDIRATGVGQPVKLIQKANVYQNSGEDWKNVKLKLSTITPSTGISKPYLSPLYLGYYDYYRSQNSKDDKRKEYAEDISLSERGFAAGTTSSAPVFTSAQFTQVNQTMTSVEYEINLPYNIPTDGKTHIVAVQDLDLKAEFVHYLVPRIDKQAYLVAKITEWGSFDLLPASANIYFEGTFVGETQINTGIMSDTLELSLGVDRGLIVERKKNKDEIRNELIGNNVIKTIKYDIVIKSNKLMNTNIIIEDNLPLSQEQGIKIEKINLGGAEQNETTGLLTWKIKLDSKQSKTISYSYTIEYDKDKPLANIF